jgi:hypothetical protein
MPAERRRRVANDAEPQTRALDAGHPVLVGAEKSLEEAGALLLGNAEPVVAHFYDSLSWVAGVR